MKSQLLLFLAMSLCVMALSAQPINTEITAKGKKPVLLGKINKEGLSTNTYAEWFNKNYEEYNPNQTSIDSLKNQLGKYTITAFMGTWCGDSKREVPRFYKVLEEANFPLERLTMVGVSRDRDTYKQSPGGEEENLSIHRVPTFIIYKNGKELNRIVESPVTSIEEDLEQILQKNYNPKYQGVPLVHDLLTEIDSRKFQKKQKRLIPELKKVIKKTSELNTYSSVLFYAHKKEEALAVAKINTLLFPEEASTYQSLGNKLFQMDDKKGAIENYKKAVELDPTNEKLKNMLAKLQS